ncbi:hypothetical protein [Dickeya chrysanthemi]|uniref:hypothetical protein n=1 Tax=Dickeya chrysanthemi TaxID=556 RepID=UPI000532FC22|nr:hypothetical protein [Dickeya chrysanthemi]
MKNKINMFATTNDTSRWVLAIDGFIQSFGCEADAKALLEKAISGRHFDDTGYDSCDIIPPWYAPTRSAGVISGTREIDLLGYIDKHVARRVIKNSGSDPLENSIKARIELNNLWRSLGIK